jgi:peptide chain release factor subunit 1
MARTITWNDLRALASVEVNPGRAISLYLDLDPGSTPTHADAQARFHSLLDEAGKLEAAETDGLSHDDKLAFRADLERLRFYFERDFDRSETQGLAIFCSGPGHVWTTWPLVAPVADRVAIDTRLVLAPLVPLVGRGGEAVVVLVGRELGRFYELRDGRLELMTDLSEEQPRRHDQGGWAQARLQRHVDELAAEHLKAVATEIDRLLRRARHRIAVVVAAPEESRAELASYLTKEAHAALAGWAHAEPHAGAGDLAGLAAPILAEGRVDEERALLDQWRDELGGGVRAASGWDETLESASDGRVETLLVAAGTERPAWRCPVCGRGAAFERPCLADGTPMRETPRGVDLALHQTLRHGGSARVVERFDDLAQADGIGALLRY